MFNLLFRTFDDRCSTLLEGLAISEAACRREGLSVPAATRFSFFVDPAKKGCGRNSFSVDREKICAYSQPAQGVSI